MAKNEGRGRTGMVRESLHDEKKQGNARHVQLVIVRIFSRRREYIKRRLSPPDVEDNAADRLTSVFAQ